MTWQDELQENICTIEKLEQYIELSLEEKEHLQEIIEIHPMSVSRDYISLIDKNDPDDPIRKMIIPSLGELDLSGAYDTSGEQENTKMPGLQHKYPQTALFLATNRCTSYCRYCFRKRLVGLPNTEILQRLQDAIEYIKLHKEINNVLITGGDSLILPTSMLEDFLDRLSTIAHLKFIRFGTKTPVTFPDRIIEDQSLLEMLRKHSSKQRRLFISTQFNHPKEITPKVLEAVDKLLKAGVIINNQSVLMKGVNDQVEVLAELQNSLMGIGVVPYYLFQCRPVKRVKQAFQVSLRKGYEIVEQAKERLNGYSKRFKYVMSHRTGKIEIVGIEDDYIYFKHHQAKNSADIGKFFRKKINGTARWLDELDD